MAHRLQQHQQQQQRLQQQHGCPAPSRTFGEWSHRLASTSLRADAAPLRASAIAFGAFAARTGRFRQLRKSRVDTAMLMRTGGVAALMYGVEVSGASPTMLRRQRRVVAAAAAPGHGFHLPECYVHLSHCWVASNGADSVLTFVRVSLSLFVCS